MFRQILVRGDSKLQVQLLDVQPSDRNLLLMARDPSGGDDSAEGKQPHKFLYRHGERSWFVAAVPERRVFRRQGGS